MVVVATIDSTCHHGVFARIAIVHIRLDDIARRQNPQSVSTTEDVLNLNVRLFRHVNHRTGGVTLSVAAAVGITDFTMQQIDNG